MIAVSRHEAVKDALFNKDLLGRPHSPGLLAKTFHQRLGIRGNFRVKLRKSNECLILCYATGIMFVDGPLWQEQRRFTVRHLKELGFGKTSIEDQMMNEVLDLLKEIKHVSESDPNHVVDFKGRFQVSVVNIIWAVIGGKRFERDDLEFKKVLFVVEQFFALGTRLVQEFHFPHLFLKFSPRYSRVWPVFAMTL